MSDANASTTAPVAVRCARCQSALGESERVPAGDRVFCRTCFDIVKLQARTGAAAASDGINYPIAAVGAILGGAVGALAWWGVTVLTHIGFGLVAVVIGLLVGHGTLRFAGGKRSVGLQVLAVVVGALSFLVAVFLVNMTFLNAALAQRGDAFRVTFPPPSLEAFYRVIAANFGIMKLVFLAIIVYEAWFIPHPIKPTVAQ
jgi:hypothetical protein